MKNKAIFIAATGQHVGKTTLCLGIYSGILKRLKNVGFIKPVGQHHIQTEDGTLVDKDAAIFHKRFGLTTPWKVMSPIIIPRGFTRGYLDHVFALSDLKSTIQSAFDTIQKACNFTLVEGTGHVGVGSIIDLNNADVAKLLNIEIVIIASGGLGSSIDKLALNIALCERVGVKVRGVILNKVRSDKQEMILKYYKKALKKWDIPLIGCVPYLDFLSQPTMKDFEFLFNTELISGHQHHYRHFRHVRLVAGSIETYQKEMVPNELVITPASREKIILATLHQHEKYASRGDDYEGGLILTGKHKLSDKVLKLLEKIDIPIIYAPVDSYEAMEKITSYKTKIRIHDIEKINQAIEHVEKYIEIDQLL